MIELNQGIKDFIERMGLAIEQTGAARTAGRLLGLLLVVENPLSLDEIARLLQVSKASISTNIRLYRQLGLVHLVSIPGDRRDYYKLAPDAFEHVLEVRLQVVHDMVPLIERGIEAIGEENETARSRLEEMRAFYAFADGQIKVMLAQWKAQKHRI